MIKSVCNFWYVNYFPQVKIKNFKKDLLIFVESTVDTQQTGYFCQNFKDMKSQRFNQTNILILIIIVISLLILRQSSVVRSNSLGDVINLLFIKFLVVFEEFGTVLIPRLLMFCSMMFDGLVSLFNGISTFVGHLIPKPFS